MFTAFLPNFHLSFFNYVTYCSFHPDYETYHITGLVSQEPVLFTGSIIDNIGYGKDDATKEEMISAAKMANAHDFIMAFPDGYDTQVCGIGYGHLCV